MAPVTPPCIHPAPSIHCTYNVSKDYPTENPGTESWHSTVTGLPTIPPNATVPLHRGPHEAHALAQQHQGTPNLSLAWLFPLGVLGVAGSFVQRWGVHALCSCWLLGFPLPAPPCLTLGGVQGPRGWPSCPRLQQWRTPLCVIAHMHGGCPCFSHCTTFSAPCRPPIPWPCRFAAGGVKAIVIYGLLSSASSTHRLLVSPVCNFCPWRPPLTA